MEDPVVPLERNLYGHLLPGLLWERQFEKILLKHGWEKIPNCECLFVHRQKGLFLSVYVDDIKMSRFRLFDLSFPNNTPSGWFVLGEMSRTVARSQGVLILFFSFVVTTPHPLLRSKHGMGSVGFRWRYAHNFGLLVRGASCTNVPSHASLQVNRESFSMFTTQPMPAKSACYEVSRANSHSGGTGKRISRMRSVARTVSPRRRISGLAMELVNGHESFRALNS